jgi:exodeoxyribonuclease VII small subunit
MSEPIDLEKSFARIEEIVKKLESGKEALTTNIALFEEATLLIKSVEKALKEAEEKIADLIKID